MKLGVCLLGEGLLSLVSPNLMILFSPIFSGGRMNTDPGPGGGVCRGGVCRDSFRAPAGLAGTGGGAIAGGGPGGGAPGQPVSSWRKSKHIKYHFSTERVRSPWQGRSHGWGRGAAGGAAVGGHGGGVVVSWQPDSSNTGGFLSST